MSLNYKLIGRRIKEIRKMKGITQATLAERAERSVPYISLIETAKKEISLKTIYMISEALSVTIDTLLAGNQANDPLAFHSDLAILIDDCSSDEKRVIYEIASATKNSLRNNSSIQSNI